MRHRRVILLASAETDLFAIEDWLTEVASAIVAERFVDRIVRHLEKLEYASERGTIRNENTGLRLIGLIDGISVAFIVDSEIVAIHRILYRGQNLRPDEMDSEGDRAGDYRLNTPFHAGLISA
jgi:plasmid stabilization system protein ParE